MTTFLMEAPAPTEAQLAEIERLQASKARKLRLREESWERSDTDGFLSQWAMDLGAQRDDRQIEILQHGGMALFPVLCDAEGSIVADHVFSFPSKFHSGSDLRWKLPEALAERCGRKWIPVGEKSRVQRELGLHEEDRWMPAKAIVTGRGHGLSGSAWVATVRADREEA